MTHALACRVLLVATVAGGAVAAVAAQPDPALERRKAELEIRKLELETRHLAEGEGWSAPVLGVLGLLAGVAGTAATMWAARRSTIGALDQSVHEKRIELYPKLVAATEKLALYFPPEPSVGPGACRAVGVALRAWYFEHGGGILLSTEARDAYFRLARALTRASLAEELAVPVFPVDAAEISAERIAACREALARDYDLGDVEAWPFGRVQAATPAHRFKDFVFLQQLSSALRTKLSEDLRSRRRPAV